MEQRIQEIRELEKRATPGPWECIETGYDGYIFGPDRKYTSFGGECYEGYVGNDEPDVQLIIALRNNILAILDDNERLLNENAQLQRERDAAVGDIRAAAFDSCLCDVCARGGLGYGPNTICAACASTGGETGFAWRGPQEVEHLQKARPPYRCRYWPDKPTPEQSAAHPWREEAPNDA